MLKRSKWFFITTLLLAVLFLKTTNVNADNTPNPIKVAIAGSFQDELGAVGDWQPDSAVTSLTYDANDDVWQGTFTLPAGDYEYKVALNGSWNENYGLNGVSNGANIPINLSENTQVKFYYDHKTHWVTSNINSVIATIAGNFQSGLGGSSDWDPGCLRSWLQDGDGDGIYELTADLPAGDYECKVAINEMWNENYGLGGVQNGTNIPFTLAVSGPVHFYYNAQTHILMIKTGIAIISPLLKTDYEIGESLDLRGLKVASIYSNGATEEIPVTIANISGFDSSVPASGQIVTVTVDGQTATISVNIITTQPVTKIKVKGINNITKVRLNSTLQMIALISPDNASYKSVTWSVLNDTGSAEISSDGLLTGVSLGNVTVIVTANDGSVITGKCIIKITSK